MKIKKIISIILISIYLITLFANFNVSNASIKEGDTLLLQGDHECDSLVQFYIKDLDFWAYKSVYYVYYEDVQTKEKYPAFCVEPVKDGVGTGYDKYNASLTKDNDEIVWRILSKGYMGSKYTDWNLECDDDLYSATKIAVHSYKEGINPKGKYRVGDRTVDGNTVEEIQRRGTKVLDLAEELYEYGINGKEKYEEPELLVDTQEKGKVETIGKKEYYVQNYSVLSNRKLESYDISISNFISGTKILDSENKEKSNFKENIFRIAIPVDNLKENILGKIEIKNAKIKTCPVYYCHSLIEGAQSYVTYTSGYEYIEAAQKLELEVNTAKLSIKKIDEETKKPIEGVKFKITDEKNKSLGEYVTDKNGEIKLSNLMPGIVYVEEIEAPKEYKIDKTKKKVVLQYGKTSIIEIKNELQKGKLKIIKVDGSDNSKTLEGVEFDLLDENKNIIKHLITDKNGESVVENLSKGTYTLRETKTIEGYILDEATYKIEIKPAKTFELKIENEKKPEEPEKPELPKLPRTGF